MAYTKEQIDLLRQMGDVGDYTQDNDTGLYTPKSADQAASEASADAAANAPQAQPNSLMHTLMTNPKNVAFNPTAMESKGDIAYPSAGPFKPDATPSIVQSILDTYGASNSAKNGPTANPDEDEPMNPTGSGAALGVADTNAGTMPSRSVAGAPSTSPTAAATGGTAGTEASQLPEDNSNPLASMANYRRALEASNNLQGVAGLGQSLNLINAGLTRTEPTAAQNAAFEGISNQGKDIEAQYLKQVEFQKQDPASPISKVYNDFLAKQGIQLPPGKYSAADLEKVAPMAFKGKELELTAQAKHEENQLKRASIETENEKNRLFKQALANQSDTTKRDLASQKAEVGDKQHQSKAKQEALGFLESSRNLPDVRQALLDKYNINKAESLMKGKDLNQISNQSTALLINELSKIARGGVPTQEELKAITPNTLTGRLSKAYSNLINDPTPARAGGFLKEYQSYLKELKANANDTISKKVSRVIESKKPDMGEENYNSLKSIYGEMLNPDASDNRGPQSENAHPQDAAAIKWAKDHPEDPRSAQILQANGAI